MISKQKIFEGNKLIAEFMDVEWIGECWANDHHYNMAIKTIDYFESNYHSSWDCLMKCWFKFQ